MLSRATTEIATYWAPTGDTDRYGKPVLGAPQTITVRWEDRLTQVINKSGEQIMSKARVYSLTPIDMDGYLAQGTHSDTDPRPLNVAFEVQAIATTPDLRSLKSLSTAYL